MESEWLSEAESVFDRISRAQEEALDGFSADLSVVGDGREKGEAPLAPGKIRLDRERFARCLAKTLTIIQDWLGGSDILGRPEDEEWCCLSDVDLESLFAAAIGGGGALEERSAEFAARLKSPLSARPEVFACAVRYALAPFLRAYARELGKRSGDESHLAGRCPVCGAEPFMAEFDAEDGRRRLACGLCGTGWRFPRLECPFCGNKDQRRLGFLEVENFEGYRVDVCEGCKRYVKTVDRRSLVEPITLELADILTAELDEAALGRGYGLRAADGGD